jgi:hypothetical protein
MPLQIWKVSEWVRRPSYRGKAREEIESNPGGGDSKVFSRIRRYQ